MAMAPLEPVGGLWEFLAILSELGAGEREPYPFYCALLYTVAEGLDAELSRYVDEQWDELDAMTGDTCLVFVVGAGPCADVGNRPFAPHEVYRIAEHLGVRPSALPCAAFLSQPNQSRDVLRVRLTDFLRASSRAATMTDRFRGIASALNRCADSGDDGRLECLRTSLVDEYRRWNQQPTATASGKLDAAVTAAGSVEKVVAAGTTVGAALMRVLGAM